VTAELEVSVTASVAKAVETRTVQPTPTETVLFPDETVVTPQETVFPEETIIAPEETDSAPGEMATATPTASQLEESSPDEAQADQLPSEAQMRLLAQLESLGPAPELHNQVWLNSEALSLGDLRGQVVLVEFWTFG
jgi:hypothetical protein